MSKILHPVLFCDVQVVGVEAKIPKHLVKIASVINNPQEPFSPYSIL
jgi:hypothetical protein